MCAVDRLHLEISLQFPLDTWEKMLRLCKFFPVSEHWEARGFGFFFPFCTIEEEEEGETRLPFEVKERVTLTSKGEIAEFLPLPFLFEMGINLLSD